ncbi:helix-turn-helix domain-containing protein [Luteimonas yanweni]
MQTVLELGEAEAARRRALGLKQGDVAARAGISQESLSRFERGRLAEFGSRKLLAVLAAQRMELEFAEVGASGSLDELRRERGASHEHVRLCDRPRSRHPGSARRLEEFNDVSGRRGRGSISPPCHACAEAAIHLG